MLALTAKVEMDGAVQVQAGEAVPGLTVDDGEVAADVGVEGGPTRSSAPCRSCHAGNVVMLVPVERSTAMMYSCSSDWPKRTAWVKEPPT